jgi:hypothetical protein
MELLFLQFSAYKNKINGQYHAKRNKKIEAVIKDHQRQARAARISRTILPQSNKAEDLETWRVAQVHPVHFSSVLHSYKLCSASNYRVAKGSCHQFARSRISGLKLFDAPPDSKSQRIFSLTDTFLLT